jgi:hypothetical protein
MTGFTLRIPMCDFFTTERGVSIRTQVAAFSAWI